MYFKNYEIYQNNSGIYMIKNLVNDKVYIGQTTMRFIKRFWHHQWLLNHNRHDNKHLQKAWNKYGAENFEFSVLYLRQENESLNNKEIEYIKMYDATNKGYNIQSGGNVVLCNYIPASSRKRVGEINRRRMIGSKLSDSTKLKMSKSRRGAKNNFAKLTEEDVVKIKEMIRDGYKPKEIYPKFNITYGNFKMIRSGKTWKNVQI